MFRGRDLHERRREAALLVLSDVGKAIEVLRQAALETCAPIEFQDEIDD